MNKYLLLFLVLIGGHNLSAQCLVNSLTINTGYDPLTGLAIPGGADGATPVPDPHWTVTAESPGIATAITATGLVEVVPGASADVVTAVGGWTSAAACGWLTCINSNTYNTDGTGPTGTPYNMTISRPFRMCTADSIKLDLYIANDNYISSTDVDGVPLGFSQPALAVPANFTMFTHFTQTVYLTAGTHTLNVVVNNWNDVTPIVNPSGMCIYGTASSASGFNSLVSESFATCLTYPCSSVCNALSLPDTLYPCAGSAIVLPATVIGTDSVLSILWAPAAGLNYDTILDPTLTVTTSGWYDITLKSLIPYNLVVNGDFSAGNTGFSSSYGYATGAGSLEPEGLYSVTTDPILVHPAAISFGDHTTGTGEMMVINGASSAISVWCETIPVVPFTDYDFAAWAANWSTADVGAADPVLQFQINGVLIGSPFTISSAPGVWNEFAASWNSGVSTTATICIYDETTAAGGNDFALDDISFQEICITKDSVYIDVTTHDTTYNSWDTTLCIASGPVTLTAPAGDSSYLWNTGSTGTSVSAAATGAYWVRSRHNCTLVSDTFNVNYIPLPVVFLGNDTAFCVGNTLTLSSIQPAGMSYLWSDGSTGDSIVAAASGTYWLQLNNGCTVTDSIHITISPFPVVDLGPDTLNCFGMPVLLQSSVAYIAPSYLWSDASTGDSLLATATATYWLQVTVAGCSAADSINVAIKYDTFLLANKDTAVCKGKFVQVRLNADASATFQWLPTAGIEFSTVSSPLITPDTSAEYTVNIYMAGCPTLKDSFFLDVQPIPNVFMGGNRFVCQFDTIHLVASVSPPYAHYTYSWTPGTYLNDTTMSAVVFTAGLDTKMALAVTTPAGCIGVDTAQITVQPGNFATLDSSFNICPHDSVQLMASGAASYHWTPGIYLDDSTSATPWAHAITDVDYSLIATSQYGCRDTLTTQVRVRPAAVLYLGDSVVLSPGQSYQLSPQTNCVTFAWFPPAGLDNAYISNPVAMPELSTKYIATGWTEWGCKAVDSISIYFDGTSLFALPNAFTPGAGVNNKLFLIKRGAATLNYFRIFNRWGEKVYESNNIDDGWDGTYNGKPQPFDVYVYELEATGNDGSVFHKHGNITLLR